MHGPRPSLYVPLLPTAPHSSHLIPSRSACFDPLIGDPETISVAALPPLPDTPEGIEGGSPVIVLSSTEDHVPIHRRVGECIDSGIHRGGETGNDATCAGKLVDIVTPVPNHRTLQRNASVSDEFSRGTVRPFERGSLAKEQEVNGAVSLERESHGDARGVGLVDDGDMATPRPIRKPLDGSPTGSPKKETDVSFIAHTTINEPSKSLRANATAFPGLDETCGEDLMGDDQSFVNAMLLRSSDDSGASPPPLGASKGPDDGGMEGGRATKGQGFSVLAGMAAFEASHLRTTITHDPIRLVINSPATPDPVPSSIDAAPYRSTDLLFAPDQAGEVSTVLPSSPSIKRYLATTRSGTMNQISGREGIVDETRLDMVDLADLRSTTVDDRTIDDEEDALKPAREVILDQSTIYPSSPAVRRNMMRGGEDLMRADMPEVDRRLDQSLYLSPTKAKGKAPGREAHGIARGSGKDEFDPTTTSVMDQSTIYPSSPAVRRNMMRVGEDLIHADMPEVDPRLDQSIYIRPDKGKQRDVGQAGVPAFASGPPRPSRSPTKRTRTQDQGLESGDQTMDIGAMIKKTSRKLTSDCADMTFVAPVSRTTTMTGSGRGQHDMSMLMDTQSPFKRREGINGDGSAEESFYDLLAGDNTFMKQVEQVTIEDDR